MISQLHYITQDLEDVSHQQLAINACKADVDWIQLRIKNKSFDEWLNIAWEVKKICHQYKVKLIINDNVKIATIVNADGVHLGKTDIDPLEARKELGAKAIIGGTANTFDDVKTLVDKGIDYIGLGPYHFTSTKSNLSPILELRGYKEILEQCKTTNITVPIIAIGGILSQDVKELISVGVYGIAVSSAITFSKNLTETIDVFKKNINHRDTENTEKNREISV
jgi:thiamine-phosphate pyrophosphorylase